jgi:uncharacterized lipoprotein YbaY
MKSLSTIVSLALGVSMLAIVGCKTEKVYNSPAPAEHTTVVEQQPVREHVETTVPEQPKVENNIKVEH